MTDLRVREAAERARAALGEDFVSCFYDRAEAVLGVEVVVVPLKGDGYAMALGGRSVVVLAATDRWFRGHVTLAHELGHLLVEGASGTSSADGRATENTASAFAANLLMPEETIRSIDWSAAQPATVAQVVWDLGVSTHALEARLRFLAVAAGEDARRALASPTEELLLESLASTVATSAQVTARMQYTARRRFPERVVTGLRRAVADGRAPRGSLSWVLGLPASPERAELDGAGQAHALDSELLDGLV